VFTSYDDIFLLGRVLSALLDLGTLVWLYLIAREIYDARIGLVAMAFGALSVLNIQQAHFFTADTFATFFVVAAMYFVVRAGNTGSWLDAVAAGAVSGLAIASRINVIPVLGVLAVALAGRVIRAWGHRDDRPGDSRSVETASLQFLAAAAAALITFRVFMPYAFDGLISLDERWTGNMAYIQRVVSGEDPGGPPGVQWTDRQAIVFPWLNMVFWGLGLPLGLTAWAGWAAAGWQTFASPLLSRQIRGIGEWLRRVFESKHLLIWVWVSGYFAWQGIQWVKSMRYLLPVYPFLAIFAGWALISLWRSASARAGARAGDAGRLEIGNWRLLAPRSAGLEIRDWSLTFGVGSLIFVVLTGTFLWAVAFTEIYRRPSTRIAASEWIYENVPSAVTLRYASPAAGGTRAVQLQFPVETMFAGPGFLQAVAFTVPADGELNGVTFQKLANVARDTASEASAARSGSPDVLRVKIALDAGGQQVLAEEDLPVPGDGSPQEYDVAFAPVPLQAGQQYFLVAEALNGPLIASSSVLGNEHWDDPVPLRIGGRDGYSFYRGLELQNYNEDTPDKLGQILSWLEQADYMFLTSNRLYASIPRQPLRYPLTSEFYRLLFTGQLGFDLIQEYASYPTLGPFEFPDQETTQALDLWPDPTRLPNPGVISVPYPPAEEAFSVYDHPRVLIFKKRPDFSLSDAITRLSGFDLEAAYHGNTPRSETASPTGQMLVEEAWQTQQASGTWSDLFDRDSILNANPGLGVVVWYVAAGALGLIVFPILYLAVPGLADRGYGLARTAAVLLLSFLVWFPASFRLLPFTRETIFVAALAMAVAAGLIARSRWAALKDFVRRNARLILIEEAVFLAAFALFLLLRFGNPDLWHPWKGGEKPMDFAYFNAVIKSQYFPPYDPWFSGGFLTYYYYGWVMFGALVKLLGIVPAIAYNLVVPTIYAMAAIGTFSVAHGLAVRFGQRSWQRRHLGRGNSGNSGNSRNSGNLGNSRYSRNLPIAVGVVAAVFVMLIGNLGEVKLIYDEVAKLGQPNPGAPLDGPASLVWFGEGLLKLATGQQALALPTDWWYWNPTRIIPPGEGEAGPITEFPFFTFLYADLHAHMMALPLTILVLALAVSWVIRVPLGQPPTSNFKLQTSNSQPFDYAQDRLRGLFAWLRTNWPDVLSLMLGGLTIGALRATNTADYPTYVGVAIVALAFGTWPAESLKEKDTWFRIILRVGLLLGSAILLFSPFAPSDRLGGTAIDGWTGSRTEWWAYVMVHGIFLFPIVTYLFVEMRRWGLRWSVAAWNRLGAWGWLVAVPAVAVALVMLYFALTGVTVIFIALPVIAASLPLMLRPRLPGATRFWLLMVVLALTLSLAVELVVFRGDISRMNMVFKFYYQIWVLLGIAGAVALGWLWARLPVEAPRWSGAWRTMMVILVAAGLLYPPFAARGKLAERFYQDAPLGLDGMAYMADSLYTEVDNAGTAHELNLRWDYEALNWMQDNVVGTPVVAEGRSRHEYLWGGRVSIYTGLPTLMGWGNHQRQQRGVVVPHSLLDRRIEDTQLLFSDPSVVTAKKILDRYDVRYVYVGELEKMAYPQDGLAKLDRMVQDGMLRVVYQNPGVKVYEVIGVQ
jgi:YYY domain-containing protein